MKFANILGSAFGSFLTLLANFVRVVSGPIIGVDLFFHSCLWRLAMVTNDIRARVGIYFLVLFLTTLGLGLSAPTYIFLPFVKIMFALHLLRWPASIAFIMASLPIRDYKNLISIGIVALCTIVFIKLIGVSPQTLFEWVHISKLTFDMAATEYMLNAGMSVFDANVFIAKTLSDSELVADVVKVVSNSCADFLKAISNIPNTFVRVIGYCGRSFENGSTSIDEYIKLIEKNDYAYFLHNKFRNNGSIYLAGCNITDEKVSSLMASLEAHPKIAKLILRINLSNNNITYLKLAKTLVSLKDLDLGFNRLNNVDFPDDFLVIDRISLENNQLVEINIPNIVLNRLRSLNLNNNPLTDATRYGLRKLRARLPRLRLGIDEQFEEQPQPDALNASMLQQHVDALVPYSITPPQHLNSVTAKTRVNLALVTLWLERKKREQKKNYEINLVNEVAKYLDGYPVTSGTASARVYGSLNMIERMMSPVNVEDGTVFNNFLNQYEFDANGDIAKKTNNMFHQSVTRGVRDAANIFSNPDSALSANIRAVSKKLFDA